MNKSDQYQQSSSRQNENDDSSSFSSEGAEETKSRGFIIDGEPSDLFKIENVSDEDESKLLPGAKSKSFQIQKEWDEEESKELLVAYTRGKLCEEEKISPLKAYALTDGRKRESGEQENTSNDLSLLGLGLPFLKKTTSTSLTKKRVLSGKMLSLSVKCFNSFSETA